MPESGKYLLRAGWVKTESSFNVMQLDGREVSRRNIGDEKLVRYAVDIEGGKRYPVKITYFNGGGNWFRVSRLE